MKNVKRKIGKLATKLIVIVFVMSSLQATARNPYEFSVYAGGGYSFFIFRPYTETVPIPRSHIEQPSVNHTSSSGASGDLGVGFTGFVAPQVGLHIGLGFGITNIGVKVDSIKAFSPDLIDANGLDFDLYTALFNYRETHRTFCLSIPLMFQFQSQQDNYSWNRRSTVSQSFYAMAGVKLNVLLSKSYESSIKTLRNEAYYPEYNNWAATQTFAGLGNFKGRNANGNIGYIHVLFSFEAGMKWRISDNMFLYTGPFLDFGLNDPTKNSRTLISDYDYINPTDLDLSLMAFSSQTNMMTIGVKVRLAFIKYSNQLSCPQF